jgi:hypothetical protein
MEVAKYAANVLAYRLQNALSHALRLSKNIDPALERIVSES